MIMPPAKKRFAPILLALVLALLAFLGGWFANGELLGDFKAYKLSGGREVILLRDLEKVFPVYAKSVKAELELALKEKTGVLDAAAGGKYEDEVKKLYSDLDTINSDVRSALISGYSALIFKVSATSDPSLIAVAFAKWDEILELVVREAFRIRAINQQLAAAKTVTSGSEWSKLFELGDQALQVSQELKRAAREADALKR
ncbi:MAG TPA: hypothetical protein VF179_19940 [Thermoanaerobaculia bacterium]|nr:hypothetical protein [Thermoanaerobaculia bacterium]